TRPGASTSRAFLNAITSGVLSRRPGEGTVVGTSAHARGIEPSRTAAMAASAQGRGARGAHVRNIGNSLFGISRGSPAGTGLRAESNDPMDGVKKTPVAFYSVRGF